MEKTKIIVIVGPTAVGKTNLSIAVANEFDGEIISGDSMQIYRHLNIGTAKATAEEQAGIPHHLIDEIEASESYSVTDFQKKAKVLIQEMASRGKCPVIVGGTGLYIESLVYDVSFGGKGKSDAEFRAKKENEAKKKGNFAVWQELNKLDPKSAENIHFNNIRRVIRALEVYEKTGQLFSDHQNEREIREPVYDAKIIGLTTDRALLYKRIDLRAEQMIQRGLMAEAQWLYDQHLTDKQAAQAIGYKEWFPYFEKKCTAQEVKEHIQQNSRRYAKRQLTWFRNRLEEITWWDLIQHSEKENDLMEDIRKFLTNE